MIAIDGYWLICVISLIVGALLVVLGIIGFDLSDYIGIETLTLAGFFVFFGGTGMILIRLSFSLLPNILLSTITTLILSSIVHFLVVIPMRRIESSAAVSQRSYIGNIAVVTIPIPVNGCGEVAVRGKLTQPYQIASSLDNIAIKTDAKVVVVDIKQGVLLVSPYDELS